MLSFTLTAHKNKQTNSVSQKICRFVVTENSGNHLMNSIKGSYFIDRSPKYFESILNFLRTGEIECPGCLDMKFLLQEAEYYGIEGMVEKIRTEIETKEAFDAHMRKHWEEQNCIQQCCQNYLSQIANYTSRQVEEQRFINYNHPGKFLIMSTEFNKNSSKYS